MNEPNCMNTMHFEAIVKIPAVYPDQKYEPLKADIQYVIFTPGKKARMLKSKNNKIGDKKQINKKPETKNS